MALVGGLRATNCGNLVLSASNGVDFFAGQLGLVRFAFPRDLTADDDGFFRETAGSGEPVYGVPCDDENVEFMGDDIG